MPLLKFYVYYNLCDVNFVKAKIYGNARALPRKSKDFRTFLEIYSFVLAGEPTDTNFIYYKFNTKPSWQIIIGIPLSEA